MKVDYSSYTNVGNRKINEDSYGIFKNNQKIGFLLCDGLGGHGMGDKASDLVKSVFENQFLSSDKFDNEFISSFFCASQDILLAQQKQLNAVRKMKTTAVTAVYSDKKVFLGHIGDSRIYFFRKGKIKYRTLDHSVVQLLVDSKEIDESQIRNHPERNILLSVLGTEWKDYSFEIDKSIKIKNNDALLLCSDGFWELINEDEMCNALEISRNASEWLEKMVKIVFDNGKNIDMDNNTAITVRFTD